MPEREREREGKREEGWSEEGVKGSVCQQRWVCPSLMSGRSSVTSYDRQNSRASIYPGCIAEREGGRKVH